MKKRQKVVETINETKYWFFEKVNKIDKPSTNQSRMRRKTLSYKIELKRGTSEQISRKSKESCGNILQTYTNKWKI
jgi:predicted P-loop ATPase/GTPase